MKLAFVYLPVWIAVSCWMLGAFARSVRIERLYQTSWLAGSLSMMIHIVGSYGVVHDWSHAAAIEATRQESLAVTGIAADWGVYANFLFAGTWLGYSLWMLVANGRKRIDRLIFGFTSAIIFFATVVFESGVVRWLALLAFAGLLIHAFLLRWKSIQKRSSEG